MEQFTPRPLSETEQTALYSRLAAGWDTKQTVKVASDYAKTVASTGD